MKITIENNVVEFTPETPAESQDLETLWRVTVDCLHDNRHLSPIGEYTAVKNKVARFVIEGLPATT
jgi:hypothetical protein